MVLYHRTTKENAAAYRQRHLAPDPYRFSRGRDGHRHCHVALGQTIRRALQSRSNVCFLSAEESEVLGWAVLLRLTIHWRNYRCRDRRVWLRDAPRHEAVRYAVTAPGVYGDAAAFIAELTISFILMATILFASNHAVLSRYTPYLVGALYAM
jgi:hypothetical protein